MLEKGFLAARAEIESGAYDFGISDDEQAGEVGGASSSIDNYIHYTILQGDGYLSDTSDGTYSIISSVYRS